jgi:hypothetical protein
LFEVQAENQIDTRSLPKIASTDHFVRKMDHMAECVLRDQKPRTPGEEGLRNMIHRDDLQGRERPSNRICMTWIDCCSHTIFGGLR